MRLVAQEVARDHLWEPRFCQHWLMPEWVSLVVVGRWGPPFGTRSTRHVALGVLPSLRSPLRGTPGAYAPIVTSQALTDWTAKRASSIALAWQMHSAQVASTATGWQVDQALAVVLQRMATEFQGFCRSLHDEASEVFAVTAAKGNTLLESTLRQLLTTGRDIDKGNAHSDAIARDFSRFGFLFWSAMVAADNRAGGWPKELKKLTEMRNGVAHDDAAKLRALATEGYVLNEPTLKAWQTTLHDIATTMDDVVGLSLGALLGVSRPW